MKIVAIDSNSNKEQDTAKIYTKDPIYANVERSTQEPIYQNVKADNSLQTEDNIYEDMNAIRKQLNSRGVTTEYPTNASNSSKIVEKEGLYVDMNDLRNKISKSIIRQNIQAVKKFLPKEISIEKQTSTETVQMFNLNEIITVDGKYKNILFPKHSSATKGNIYHANKINLKYDTYIAAQGPYTEYSKAEQKNVSANTADNFIAMLAETQSPISVSLVNDGEFTRLRNDKIPPYNIGDILEIPEQRSENQTIREKTVIEKLDEAYYKDIDLQVDTFAINGKIHVRIYDLGWTDKTPGSPQRLAAIALLTEKLRLLPRLKDRIKNPIVINCNAGVSRTGTFMMVHDAIVTYNKESKMPTMNDVKEKILQARESRLFTMQLSSQLETIKSVINNPEEFVKPLSEEFALFKS